jgi:mannan endo-1,4-beta-mannosidase
MSQPRCFRPIPFLLTIFFLNLVPAHADAPSGAIHLEAEDAQLFGPTLSTQRAGYTGTGYVTNFLNKTDKIVLTTPNAKAGVYDALIHYNAPAIKGFDLVVDGSTYTGLFQPSGDGFVMQDAGNVILKDGINTVEIHYGWGHYDVDSIDLVPATIPPLKIPPATLSNPNATPAAKALESYLVSQYGKVTLSGQHTLGDTAYVESQTGKLPAIIGGDLIDYSPSRVLHENGPNTEAEDIIAAGKAGQIVTMLWHWNAPTDLIDKKETDAQGNEVDHSWYLGFYTASTTFDLENAIDNPGSPDYQLLLSDIDTIAIQLQKFQVAGIPVLWRPLHEAEGGWFWWGAKGPEPFKKLWRLMYDRLTNYHHLNNLIWVYSSGIDPNWYPGDQYVDIVGADEYPTDVQDPENGIWNTLQSEYGGRKLIALSEYGGAPDVPRMFTVGSKWSYFMSWTGDVGPHKNDPLALSAIYNSPLVVTSDKLPPYIR